MKKPGAYDGKIVTVASEVLDFIDGRKQFWALKANRHAHETAKAK